MINIPTQSSNSNFLGTYQNELKSVLKIKSISGTNFTGTYQTAVGQPTQQKEYPLSGTFVKVKQDYILVSWWVNWQNSITSWTGAWFGEGLPSIVGNYQLTVPKMQEWERRTVISGQDIFKRLLGS